MAGYWLNCGSQGNVISNLQDEELRWAISSVVGKIYWAWRSATKRPPKPRIVQSDEGGSSWIERPTCDQYLESQHGAWACACMRQNITIISQRAGKHWTMGIWLANTIVYPYLKLKMCIQIQNEESWARSEILLVSYEMGKQRAIDANMVRWLMSEHNW